MNQSSDLTVVEYIKVSSPFILLFVTLVLVPFIKRAHNSWKTFFELSTSVKIEALNYLLNPEISKNTLKLLTHKIKMRDFRLHEDIELSKKAIAFYYEPTGHSSSFSRTLLKAKGLYKSNNGIVKVFASGLFLNIFLFILGFGAIVWGLYMLSTKPQFLSDSVFSFSILLAGFLTSLTASILAYQYVIIIKGVRTFNAYKPNLS